jgi:hypothetical protein
MKLKNGTPKIDEAPWYIAGLAFECQACGRCCAGPEEGYVWANDEEILRMAKHLNMSEKNFCKEYVRKVGRRQSLVEQKKSHDCVFLKDGKCTIYEVRPTQCRTWPFWTSNIASPADWSLAGMRCVGINRGKLFTPEEIQNRAYNTRE